MADAPDTAPIEILAYSVAEAARVTGLSTWSIYRAVHAGVLPRLGSTLVGNRVLIPARALEDQLAALTTFDSQQEAPG